MESPGIPGRFTLSSVDDLESEQYATLGAFPRANPVGRLNPKKVATTVWATRKIDFEQALVPYGTEISGGNF